MEHNKKIYFGVRMDRPPTKEFGKPKYSFGTRKQPAYYKYKGCPSGKCGRPIETKKEEPQQE